MSTTPQDMLSVATDPITSLKNSLFLSIGLANLPEFSGGPQDDIEKFLQEFKRAAITLTKEQKCLALKKCLVGDAAIFLKNYMKSDISNGCWKQVKAELRKRFSRVDPNLLYRTQLNKMSFDPVTSTLLGYVDKYANLYRKIHSKAQDSEMIQDISLNLGRHIVLKLNQLSENWKAIESFEDFRKLISRLERDIMSLEADNLNHTTQELKATVDSLVSSALQSPVKEIQDILAQLNHRTKESANAENLAIVKHADYPDNRGPRESGKRSDRDWDHEPNRRRARFEKDQFSRRFSDLRRSYEERYGPVIGGCFACHGPHFKRHCPYLAMDLKEPRNRQ